MVGNAFFTHIVHHSPRQIVCLLVHPCTRQGVRDQVGVWATFLWGLICERGKKLAKFVCNAVEGSVSGKMVLKAKCLLHVKDTVEYGIECFASILDLWVLLIMETEMLMDVDLPDIRVRMLSSEGKVPM